MQVARLTGNEHGMNDDIDILEFDIPTTMDDGNHDGDMEYGCSFRPNHVTRK